MAAKKTPQKKRQVKRGVGKKRPPTSNTDNNPMLKAEEVLEDSRVVKHEDGSVHIDVTKEEMNKILHPEGFKKANELTELDDLKFEMGRLRTHFITWNAYVEHEGNLYLVQVDPLNKMVKFLGKGDGPDEEGQKIVQEFKDRQ